jgi:hypothetical protein
MFGRKIIAELAEIDENLFRSPLTPSQEASAIASAATRSMRNDRPDGRIERRIIAYGRLLHYELRPQI